MIKFESDFISNLKDISKELENTAERLSGQISIVDILTPSFMKANSKFESLEDFFEVSPFKVESEDDFLAIDEKELDGFVEQNANYSTWEMMLQAAGDEFFERNINL